ncbi:MAG TPA: hypothetical protein VFC51_15545 [Chloroflexota bacterium]|nr:hypothetical protein [Chloroflexota bacterium]
MENADAVGGQPAGRVYTVFGPRGGSGKTMLAVNLAVALAKLHPEQVGLLDLSLTFGHCALVLNAAPRTSVAAASVDSLSRLDRAGLGHYLSDHSSGLKLMVGANRAEEGDVVTGEHVSAAIRLLRQAFPISFIDTSSSFTDPTISALENADKIILVCTPELSTLRDIRECQRILSEVIHVPSERLMYLMNNPYPFKPLAMEQFVQTLEQSIDIEIPYGNDVPAKAAMRGEAFVQTQAGSAVAKAVDKLARTIEAEIFPPAVPERRGLFGRR